MNKLFIVLLLLFIPACYKKTLIDKHKKIKNNTNQELDFKVYNNTNNTLFITCFYYAIRETGVRWAWYKSPVYELKPKNEATVDIHTILNKENLKDVYGYLAIYHNEADAENSIFELLPDANKIDLPKLNKLKNKKVTIQTETYGFQGQLLDWELKKLDSKTEKLTPELDFLVKNSTEKNFYLTCFVYQRKNYHPQWVFDKTNIIKINSNETKLIDVDTIVKKSDREDAVGYLAIFEENEKKKAEESTFELLNPAQKIAIGKLSNLKNKIITIIPKTYGILGGFNERYSQLEYISKPVKPTN